MKKLPAQPVNGLIDGLEVLQELAVSRGPVSCKALSEKLNIELTRMNRILKTLDYLGIAYRTQDRKYKSGPGIHVLAIQSMLGSGLLSKALPVLESLQKYGHIVALGVLWKDTVSYLYHHEPGTSSYEAIGRLSLYPATQSSIGMALLSEKENDEIEELYSGKIIPGYTAPYKNIKALIEEIEEIRQQGYAVLTSKGVNSIAVKLGNPAYASIAISGKINPNEVKKYVSILNEASGKIHAEHE